MQLIFRYVFISYFSVSYKSSSSVISAIQPTQRSTLSPDDDTRKVSFWLVVDNPVIFSLPFGDDLTGTHGQISRLLNPVLCSPGTVSLPEHELSEKTRPHPEALMPQVSIIYRIICAPASGYTPDVD